MENSDKNSSLADFNPLAGTSIELVDRLDDLKTNLSGIVETARGYLNAVDQTCDMVDCQALASNMSIASQLVSEMHVAAMTLYEKNKEPKKIAIGDAKKALMAAY